MRLSNIEVPIALGLAGLINIAMLSMAAATFHNGHSGVADISTAYRILTPLLGPAAAVVFLISLLVSGISSSSVGTMAGQVIMQGFVRVRIPLWLRRLVTMAPTVVVIWTTLRTRMTAAARLASCWCTSSACHSPWACDSAASADLSRWALIL